MIDDVHVNKAAIIRRCLRRVRQEYQGDPGRLDDWTIQDSIVLNLQRVCAAAIDLSMHLIASRRLGIPQHSRDAFGLVQAAGLLTIETSTKMQAMVGFRNIAIQQYEELQQPILRSILENHLSDFEDFLRELALPSAENPPTQFE